MKKAKLIAGILLMILGVGVSMGSVVLPYYVQGRYGIINHGHKIMNKHRMMGRNVFKGFQYKSFNEQPNQNQGKTNPQPSQNQNNGQNANGGAK